MPEACKIRKEVDKPNEELKLPVLGLRAVIEIDRRPV